MADRCAGFELFRQLPEVSVGRGVSRFMQNGTQLPGDEAASNAVRPYRITRASFVRRPLDAATPSLLLSPPPREPLSAPERGPSLCIYIHIRMYPRTISIFEATARLLLLLLTLSRRRKWFRWIRRATRLDWNFVERGGRFGIHAARAWRRKISYNVLKGVGINRHLRAG